MEYAAGGSWPSFTHQKWPSLMKCDWLFLPLLCDGVCWPIVAVFCGQIVSFVLLRTSFSCFAQHAMRIFAYECWGLLAVMYVQCPITVILHHDVTCVFLPRHYLMLSVALTLRSTINVSTGGCTSVSGPNNEVRVAWSCQNVLVTRKNKQTKWRSFLQFDVFTLHSPGIFEKMCWFLFFSILLAFLFVCRSADGSFGKYAHDTLCASTASATLSQLLCTPHIVIHRGYPVLSLFHNYYRLRHADTPSLPCNSQPWQKFLASDRLLRLPTPHTTIFLPSFSFFPTPTPTNSVHHLPTLFDSLCSFQHWVWARQNDTLSFLFFFGAFSFMRTQEQLYPCFALCIMDFIHFWNKSWPYEEPFCSAPTN